MRSRTARLTLAILFVAALGVTAYLFWMGESLAGVDAAAARTFDRGAHAVARTLLDLRSAQQAYVAAGQSVEVRSRRVADGLASARAGISGLRESARSPETQSALDAAASVLQDFTQLDRKITAFARGGQHLMAADLIFEDGHKLLDSALASVDQARETETTALVAAGELFGRRQIFALAAAAAAALLVVLLLAPVPEPELTLASLAGTVTPAPLREGASLTSPVPQFDEGWSLPRHAPADPPPNTDAPPIDEAGPATPGGPADAPAARPADPPSDPDVVPPSARGDFATPDFGGLARLCTDLACVVDTQALPGLLERAAGLLDARGIILWIADPDGLELNPIFAQGYPPQLVNRLGTIRREAENATAAAFRTALVQTVNADAVSNGAIAAPLITPAGCVGVMAAEVRHAKERQLDTLAVATIVAAQIATLVGPATARQSSVASR
jgi:hypothetical protein